MTCLQFLKIWIWAYQDIKYTLFDGIHYVFFFVENDVNTSFRSLWKFVLFPMWRISQLAYFQRVVFRHGQYICPLLATKISNYRFEMRIFILMTTRHYMRQSVWYLILAVWQILAIMRSLCLDLYDLEPTFWRSLRILVFVGFHDFDYECLAFCGVYIFRCERHFPHRLSISCLRLWVPPKTFLPKALGCS